MTRAIVIAALSAATLIDGPPTVTGRVVADDTGNPIRHARVRLVAASAPSTYIVTDRDGRFSAAAPTGGFKVSAIKSGFVRADAEARDAAAVRSAPLDGEDGWQDPMFLDSLWASTTSGTVRDGEAQTVTLRVPAR